MSIIYDALKKVERLQSANPAAPTAAVPKPAGNKKAVKINPFIIYGFIAVLGVFLASLLFGLMSRLTSRNHPSAQATGIAEKNPASLAEEKKQELASIKQEPPQVPAAEIIPDQPQQLAKAEDIRNTVDPSSFKLSGLFFSDSEGYVLINNEILKEGDQIEGAVVKHISLDGVELDLQGQSIKLTNKK